jgi:hypothetical protein
MQYQILSIKNVLSNVDNQRKPSVLEYKYGLQSLLESSNYTL